MRRSGPTPRRLIDTRRRSIIKSIIYRGLTVLADVIVIYWVTHGIAQTITLTILTNIASTLLYYGHERIWNVVSWGQVRGR